MDETTPVAEKLRIAPSHRILTIAAPPDLPARLGALPPGVVLESRGSGPYDMVLLFAEQRRELEAEVAAVVQAVRPGGLLWICYPKLTSGEPSDLKREVVWDAVAPTGWRPVAQIAVDDTWSALRFMPGLPGVVPVRSQPARRRRATAAGRKSKAVRGRGAKASGRKAPARGAKASKAGRAPKARARKVAAPPRKARSGRKPAARRRTPTHKR
jgi:hypothetical protein